MKAENVALANRNVTESGSGSFSALLVLRRHYPFETLMSIKPKEEILLFLEITEKRKVDSKIKNRILKNYPPMIIEAPCFGSGAGAQVIISSAQSRENS